MPFAKLNGRSIHYTEHAAQTSTSAAPLTLIFVHGLGSTQNYYGPILPYLKDYRCILFDNYGAGRSTYLPEHPDTSIGEIADDVLGLMDKLDVKSAVVVGYSMGGMVPTTLAAAHPTRIISAICIGPVHPTSAVADVFSKRIATVREGGIETMANTIPYAAVSQKSSANALVTSFIREMIIAQPAEGYVANCAAIVKSIGNAPEYAKVTCPVLIIAGAEDKSAPVSGCEFIIDHLASKEKKLVVLEETGHWHCVEKPERVGKLVQEWCAGLK